MSQLAFSRSGTGDPLVLLHALGLSRRTWEPVMAPLAERFDVLAIDLPGFGESAPLPRHIEPTPAALAAAVAELHDELNIAAPHVAGNSIGGWVALELAGLRSVASLTLLSPAGLWRGHTPLYCRVSLRASRWLARNATGLLSALARYRIGRLMILGQTHGRPARLSLDYALFAIRATGTSPGFDEALSATARRRFVRRAPITTPVTVAFGSRDVLLLPGQSRHLDQLPPGTRVVPLPRAGHVPIADNPGAVTAIIKASAES